MDTTTTRQWPTTPEGWCARFRQLDERFGTDRRSPLHHDNRCTAQHGNPQTLTRFDSDGARDPWANDPDRTTRREAPGAMS